MKRLILLATLLTIVVAAPGKDVRGKVTYVAAGTIYVSIGSDAGLRDSSLVYVVRAQDTIACLRIAALSSKSASANVVTSRQKIAIGDLVVGAIESGESSPSPAIVAVSPDRPETTAIVAAPVAARPSVIGVQGRISAQYTTTRYEDPNSNVTQPAFIINMKAAARDIPLTLDVYGNYRSLSYGQAGLFSPASLNQSRLYRFSLRYNDGNFDAVVGRFTPPAAPSIGYLDGLLVAKALGSFVAGAAAGFQSRSTLGSLNTAYKKVALFTSYQSSGTMNVFASASYTRNYFHFNLDRELLSTLVSVSGVDGLGVYINGDVDFREKQGGDFVFSPSITNLHATVSYPFARVISLSLGAEISRWYSDYSFIQSVPDSLIDRSARSGVSIGVNIFAMQGMNLANTFTPRSSPEGFGKEYSNVTSLSMSNLFSSGFMFRGNVNFTSNQYTSSRGGGIAIDRSFFDVLQLSLTFQKSMYTITSLGETDNNASYSIDALWFVTREVSISADYNRLDGFGRVSHTVFGELSYRF